MTDEDLTKISMYVERNQQDIAGIFKRLDDNTAAHERLFNRVEDLEKHGVAWDFKFNTILDVLNELKSDIKAIKDKPQKHFDLIITAIISVVVSGIVGFILAEVLTK